jgi:hypothetical protein
LRFVLFPICCSFGLPVLPLMEAAGGENALRGP